MSTVEALIPGTKIGAFKIKETLGRSNHGVAYRARDLGRGRDVSIQEYLPVAFAKRTGDGVTVEAVKEKKTAYENGLTLFLQEARILAQIHDPYVARVIEYSETNGTAYLVIEHEAGQTLRTYLQNHPKLNEQGVQKILIPMLKGLRVVHSEGLLHRDVKPSSIFLRQDGPPVLTGFGSAARTVVGEHVSLDTRVTPGYSPIEQYHDDGNLGPWTDLYALGATMYRCIAGVTPVAATRRVAAIAQGDEDPLVPAMEIGVGDYSTRLLGNIDWMLRPIIAERPESAGAVLGLLSEDSRSTRSSTFKATPRQQSLGIPFQDDATSAYHLPYRSLRQTDKSARMISKLRRRVRKPNGWAVAGLILAVLIGFALWQTYHDLDDSSDAGRDTAALDKGADQATLAHEGQVSNIIPASDEPVNFGREDDDLRAEAFRELEKNQTQIEQLLASARTHIESGRLVFPPENNALSNFRAILNIDPAQVDAKQGIDDIVATLVARARESFEKRQIKQAQTQLNEVEHIQSEREDVSELKREIESYKRRIEEEERLAELQRQRETAARKQRIDNLIRQAETAMREDRLIAPDDNSALSYYRRVLQLDEQNITALTGIKEIGRRYLSKAGQAIVDGNLDRSAEYLNAATQVQADADTISLLRTQLQARRSALEEQAQRREREAQEIQQRESAQRLRKQRERARLNAGIKAYYQGAYDDAFQKLNPLADAGYPRAQFRLGVMYNRGRGVTRDAELAQQLIRKALPAVQSAATAGEAWAQADLGSLYEDGLVVAKNDVEAVRWYRLAAKQGYAGAQTNLGVMYANGTGVERDINEAIRWLQRAAAQGDKIAAENLATLGAR